MQRRDFLKISAAGGAAAALEGCGNPEHQLIRFVPEEDLVPGIATWKPSICTLCPAGCGTDRARHAGRSRGRAQRPARHPENGPREKARRQSRAPDQSGQALPARPGRLQVTYHPDRIKTPLKRTGARGSGQFKEITWDDAIKQLVSQLSRAAGGKEAGQLAFLTSPLRGQRRTIVRSFAAAFKAAPPVEFEFFDDAV